MDTHVDSDRENITVFVSPLKGFARTATTAVLSTYTKDGNIQNNSDAIGVTSDLTISDLTDLAHVSDIGQAALKLFKHRLNRAVDLDDPTAVITAMRAPTSSGLPLNRYAVYFQYASLQYVLSEIVKTYII